MVIDGNDCKAVSETIETDIVIVGAGIVGLYIAARLLEKSPERNICVIESGDLTPRIDSNFENSLSIGRQHNGTYYGRYSGLGGNSYQWGGQLAEFEQADFRRDDTIWPVQYEEMKFYYNEVYTFLGLRIPVSDNYFEKIFLNNKTSKEDWIESYYTVRLKGKDTIFPKYFRKQIENDHITIITNTTANKINFIKTKATELLCLSNKGTNISIRANKFVFAAGTMAINQFFLSAQALYDVPWRANRHIGTYFQDHLGGVIGRVRLYDERKFRRSFERRIINGIKIERKLKIKNNYRTDLGNRVVIMFQYQSKNQQIFDRFKLFIRDLRNPNRNNNTLVFLKDAYRLKGYLYSFIKKIIFSKRIHEAFDDGILAFAQSEQIPLSESRITISKDNRLQNGLYKIHVDWRWSGKEIEAIYAATTELNKYLQEQNIGELEINPGIKNRDPEVLMQFRDTNHQCGGMRMSSSDKSGVVDPNCKVWGTDNVWVAGAAVFPTSSHANSVLTALALAERMIQKSL